MQQYLLTNDWQFKPRDPANTLANDCASSNGWLPAQVPGTIHQDLLAAACLPAPQVGLHEREVQWVGEQDWLYRCSFALPEAWGRLPTIDLCFEGLDTFVTVWLNGVQVLVSDNMFVPYRVPVARLLQAGRNELCLLFESALRRGRELEALHGKNIVWGDSDSSRVHVRKAQYHYGWDWGPVLMTAGMWRPVFLQAYQTRIADLACPVEVAQDLTSAQLTVNVTLTAGETPSALTAQIELYLPTGELLERVVAAGEGSELQHSFSLAQPTLWWPHGYGGQALYRVVVTLLQQGQELDRRELRLGIRRLRLMQQPLEGEGGRSFYFEVNNTPIFCGGANWIPDDLLLPRITAERYRRWLQLAVDANMLMLRVWGGGIYEEDVFYALCDELGLLVWQDFMFACGHYPVREAFLESVRAEAEANVRRLRHHPALALWCGNNEDYMHSSTMGLYDAGFQGDFASTVFAAREIYERLLPEVCAALDADRPYWPGSPYGGMDANDAMQGDQHNWYVWHGQMANYHAYASSGGRFVSEFGMQSYPARRTIEEFAAPDERFAQSRTLEWHNKAPDGHRRLAVYLSDTLRMPASLDEYIYATQFVQAEAMQAGLSGWRRRWQGPGREYVAGALIWQLNDCWPVTSWALVDSALRPKPAYYVTRRALAPLAVGMVRNTDSTVAIWATNGTLTELTIELEITAWTLAGQAVGERYTRAVLPANRSLELGAYGGLESASWVIGARLRQEGRTLAYTTLWPEPFKYLTLPDPGITLTHLTGERLELQSTRPAKGVWLDAGDDVAWSDNMFDLLPGQPHVIEAPGLAGRAINVCWLGQEDRA